MARFNFDISSLFGGFNSNSTFGSFNFSDYASIKNGSYRKLVQSYYAKDKVDTKKSKTEKTDDKY